MSRYKHTFKSKYRCWQIPVKVDGEKKSIVFGSVIGGFYYATNDDILAAAIDDYLLYEKKNNMNNGWRVIEKEVTQTIEVKADPSTKPAPEQNAPTYVCTFPGCGREFSSSQGLASHIRLKHPDVKSVKK